MDRLANRRDILTQYRQLPPSGHTVAEAARLLGIPRKTLADALNNPPADSAPAAEPNERGLDLAMRRIKELERELTRTREARLTEEIVRGEIIKLANRVDAADLPDWTVRVRAGSKSPGVPTLMLSDLHWGEVVSKAQVNGLNEYNLAIAQRRLHNVVESASELLLSYMTPAKYPGIVVQLAGDCVSGNIHEELSKTNDAPIMPVVVDLFANLERSLRELADRFGHVLVACVTGNHGRNTRKIEAKNRNFESFDWLVYALLAKRFEGDDRVRFVLADGPDLLYRVYGHGYCVTHGDQFRGGDGMIGHIGPVKRGHRKKLSRDSEVRRPWDTMCHGHFHTYSPGPRIIGNGSLVGLSEYSMAGNFEFEPPQQALWITNPSFGITYHLPVFAERSPQGKDEKRWVSW